LWIVVGLAFGVGVFVASAMQDCPDAKPPAGERWREIGFPSGA
jgi:hypothetical protein